MYSGLGRRCPSVFAEKMNAYGVKRMSMTGWVFHGWTSCTFGQYLRAMI